MYEQWTCVVQDVSTTLCTSNTKTVGYHDWLFVMSLVVFLLCLMNWNLFFKPFRELFK